MAEAKLTTEQEFVVKRLRAKVTQAKHYLGEATYTARFTSPAIMQGAGMDDAVRMLKGIIGELEWLVSGKQPEVKEAPAHG